MAAVYSGVRESRPDNYTDVGTTSGAILRDFGGECLKHAERSFAMGIQCQQLSALQALMSMEDAVIISHSPQGCLGCSGFAADNYRWGQAMRGVKQVKNPRIFLTNLDQKSVIFGGEKKLRQTIALAEERYHPKVIFIFTSCASGIIGDDIDAVAEDLQRDTDAVIVPIHCEGFKSKMSASGYDAAFIAINRYILKGIRPERQENLLNLFAPVSVSRQDELEITRMCTELGLEINYIPFYSSLEKLRRIPQAAASTSICMVFGDEFMKSLEAEYGIPYSHTVMPIGLSNTDRWYRGVGKLFGKEREVEEIIEEEHRRIAPELDEIRTALSGKRVVVACGGMGRAFTTANLVKDFGMQLVGFNAPYYDTFGQNEMEELHKEYGDFLVDIGRLQPFEQINFLKKLKPDCFIGYNEYAQKLGIPASTILDGRQPTMGYGGVTYLGHKFMDVLGNNGFAEKLAAHTKLPYRDSWFDEDPFKYIVSSRQ